MEARMSTTPFGRRALSLAHVASQLAAKERPPDATAHKWTVFRAICEAKELLGLSDRALAVLNALLSFHPETALSGDNLVVFPSNEQLMLRAHGMPPATLRRCLAALVDAGVIVRRDSPNGKRYARKGRDGAIAQAFGFDLSPLPARAAEFEVLAEEVRAEQRALKLARERITLCRRDIAKMIATGIEEGVPAGGAGERGGVLGAARRPHRGLGPCARGAGARAFLHRPDLPFDASLPVPLGRRARARGTGEGGAAGLGCFPRSTTRGPSPPAPLPTAPDGRGENGPRGKPMALACQKAKVGAIFPRPPRSPANVGLGQVGERFGGNPGVRDNEHKAFCGDSRFVHKRFVASSGRGSKARKLAGALCAAVKPPDGRNATQSFQVMVCRRSAKLAAGKL